MPFLLQTIDSMTRRRKILAGCSVVLLLFTGALLYPLVPNTAAAPSAGHSVLQEPLTDQLVRFANETDTIDALIVASSDGVLLEHGMTHVPINTHSVRKSIMAVLVGIAVQDHGMDISQTLQELDIDDAVMPLTEVERQAQVKHLLQARSGIYIEAAGETAEMKAGRPRRGQYQPGEHYYYNNWDFNVLGTVLHAATGRTLQQHMASLSERLNMQDYTDDHLYYSATDASEHDQYVIFMSARDLLKIGQLMIREGRDELGNPVISPEWVTESTTQYSELEGREPLDGYGYLWSIDSQSETFWATGWGGQFMLVDPSNDLIIVTRNDTGRRLGHIGLALAGYLGQGRMNHVMQIRDMVLASRTAD